MTNFSISNVFSKMGRLLVVLDRQVGSRESRSAGNRRGREKEMKKPLEILMLLLLVMPVLAHGQAISVNGGAIEGTITDGSGSIVPDAAITIVGSDTNVTKSLKSDSRGFYSLGPLNPGPYTVTVDAPGFEKLTVTTVIRTGTATSARLRSRRD